MGPKEEIKACFVVYILACDKLCVFNTFVNQEVLKWFQLTKLHFSKRKALKNSKWVWSWNTTITNRRQPRGTSRKSRSTITRHQKDIVSKAASSLFPIKIIAILEWTLNNVQQNIEQLQTLTMGVKVNKKSTTTEPPP